MKLYRTTKVLFTALTSCALILSCVAAQAQPINIALGKTVTFSAPPNYSLSSDPDDIKQLTDGRYSSLGELQKVENTTAIWVQKGTVGWSKVLPVIITIDLGSVQPISGVSYSTAAGADRNDVTWPRAVFLMVSDGNKTWHSAGELMQLSRKNGSPPASGYANFRFATHDLQTKGRYVALGVVQQPYTFVDEIEIYKGDDSWMNRPVAGRLITTDLKSWIKQSLTPAMAVNRVQSDATDVKAEINASSLSASRKSTFITRLDNDVAAAAKVDMLPADFKAILPLNNEHRDVLAVHGEILAAQGFKPLTIWKQERYQWLPLLATPEKQSTPQLQISMMGNQFRSDALLLTNASGKSQIATLHLKSAPRGAQNGWLKVASVAWTDTAQGIPVADALLPVEAKNNSYDIDIPAGMTRKIWLTVDSSKLPAGAYKSTFDIVAGSQKMSVPFSVNVAAITMKKPRMSLSVWDYTNTSYAGLTPQNRASALALMRSHYVDTTWATGAALPRPEAVDFDANNNLKTKPDFTNFDQWVALWPDARHYFVYPAVGDTFAGTKMGTPEFNARVGSWVKVLSAHMKDLGKKPQQLGLLLVDEPHTDAQDAIIAAWAKAINAAAPELTLFEDPIWLRPDQTKIQDAITDVDLLCFHIPVFKAGGPEVKAYAENLLKQGKELWLYQATGPVRLYDPQLSYRQLAWHVYSIGGTGQGYWAFGDTGGAPTSWNEYAADYTTYAPVFVDKDTVYSSLHWEAVREGIEDYEELAMLQDAINASTNDDWKKQAQQVLNDAVEAVTSPWDGNRDWWKKVDANLTDSALQKVHQLLIAD